MDTNQRRQHIKEIIRSKKVNSFKKIFEQTDCSEITIRRDISYIHAITSYTHQGQFITLEDIPAYDNYGIWFYRGIGFTKYGTSLELIKYLINSSKGGLTKENIEEILRIKISQQIQTLLKRHILYRVKVGNKYLYLPETLARNKRKRIRLVNSNYLEEYYDAKVCISDLIALLKAVLVEYKIATDEHYLKRLVKKYSLKIPTKKIEQVLLKYNLTEKKTSSNS